MNIAIIEDDAITRMATVTFLSDNNISVVLEAKNFELFTKKLPTVPTPEIVLLDIYVGTVNVIENLPLLKKLLPTCKIIIFTTSLLEEDLLQAVEFGADGYYEKGANPYRLLEAINDIQKGGFFIMPQMGAKLVHIIRSLKDNPHIKLLKKIYDFDLLPREVQVLEGLVNYKSYKEIADVNNLGINTVRHYVKSVYRKMGVNNRRELIKKVA